jgi:hypothetical protein
MPNSNKDRIGRSNYSSRTEEPSSLSQPQQQAQLERVRLLSLASSSTISGMIPTPPHGQNIRSLPADPSWIPSLLQAALDIHALTVIDVLPEEED